MVSSIEIFLFLFFILKKNCILGPPPVMGYQGQSHQQQQQQHQQMMSHPPQHSHQQMAPAMPINNNSSMFTPSDVGGSSGSLDNPVLEELRDKNEYNPQDFDYDSASLARCVNIHLLFSSPSR